MWRRHNSQESKSSHGNTTIKRFLFQEPSHPQRRHSSLSPTQERRWGAVETPIGRVHRIRSSLGIPLRICSSSHGNASIEDASLRVPLRPPSGSASMVLLRELSHRLAFRMLTRLCETWTYRLFRGSCMAHPPRPFRGPDVCGSLSFSGDSLSFQGSSCKKYSSIMSGSRRPE